jgi:LysR family transcriptional regulator of abg operon
MRFTQLRDFLAVIEAGSLRAAAQRLGISQPAVTKSIRQLEDELHMKLLQRSGRGAVPTQAGKAFLARARVIHTELAKIEQDLDELRGRRGGTIVIGASPAAVVVLVPEAIMRLRRRYPDARIRLVEGLASSLIPLVRDESLDFTIGQKGLGKPDRAIRFTPLFRTQMVIAGRRGHPLLAAKSVRELADATWVTFTPAGQGGRVESMYSAAGLPPPRVTVQCESYTSALALMARTDALGIIVPQLLGGSNMHASLQHIAIDDPLLGITYGIFRRSDAPLSPAAAAMAEAVTATARQLARASR